MNPVYIRLLIYVLSTLFGLIPASWAGWVAYDAAAQVITVSVPGLATAIAVALTTTLAVFRRWGTK